MGNPAWGHGYHKGTEDGYRSGFEDGAKQGSAITAGVALGVGVLIGAATWGYDKIKNAHVAKHEQRLAAQAELLDPAEDALGDDEPPALPSES